MGWGQNESFSGWGGASSPYMGKNSDFRHPPTGEGLALPSAPPPKEFPEEWEAAGLALANGILKTAELFRRWGQPDSASGMHRRRPGLSQPGRPEPHFRVEELSSALSVGGPTGTTSSLLCTTLSLARPMPAPGCTGQGSGPRGTLSAAGEPHAPPGSRMVVNHPPGPASSVPPSSRPLAVITAASSRQVPGLLAGLPHPCMHP